MDKIKKPLAQEKAILSSKPVKAAPAKPAAASVAKKEKKVSPLRQLSHEQIALRAYFISERRRELGWNGDDQTDWIDAEKQLLAEALEMLKKS